MPRKPIDRLLPILPVADKPLIILCRGRWYCSGGYRTKAGEWRTTQDQPITQDITGWEYHDGIARGKYKGSKVVGIYVTLKPKRTSVDRVVLVK